MMFSKFWDQQLCKQTVRSHNCTNNYCGYTCCTIVVATVIFATTFCDMYYEEETPELTKQNMLMHDIGDTLQQVATEHNRQSSFFLVAEKWALRTRQYQNNPEEDRLEEYVKLAWKWVTMKENIPKRLFPDTNRITELTIGHFEKR